jgi:molecular chaperone DnaJ
MAGEGETGLNGGPAGDLQIVLSVRKHPVFTRSGDDLECTLSIGLSEAFQGTDAEAPTLEGPARIRIPARTAPGRSFFLKGRGMPVLEGKERGDLKVKIRVEVPARPTKKEREMLEELGRPDRKQRSKTGPAPSPGDRR